MAGLITTILDGLTKLFSPLGKWIKRRFDKRVRIHRVLDHFDSLTYAQRFTLHQLWMGLRNSPSSHVCITIQGGGSGVVESGLPVLIEEDMVRPTQKVDLVLDRRQHWYKVDAWLADYLREHPEIRDISSE